jgi:hypothetical protein
VGCIVTRSRVGRKQDRIAEVRWVRPEKSRHADKTDKADKDKKFADKGKTTADKETAYKSNNAEGEAIVLSGPHNAFYGRKA